MWGKCFISSIETVKCLFSKIFQFLYKFYYILLSSEKKIIQNSLFFFWKERPRAFLIISSFSLFMHRKKTTLFFISLAYLLTIIQYESVFLHLLKVSLFKCLVSVVKFLCFFVAFKNHSCTAFNFINLSLKLAPRFDRF